MDSHQQSLTYQTSPDVFNGFLDVHARPVIQHVTDTSSTVDKPDIVLASFWHSIETESQTKKQTKKGSLVSLSFCSRCPTYLGICGLFPALGAPITLLISD